MISSVFKISHNLPLLCTRLIIDAWRFNISCLICFLKIVILFITIFFIYLFGESSVVVSKFYNPLVVDIVTCLLILHYMYEIIAIQDWTSSAIILSCTSILAFNSLIIVSSLGIIIKVSRADLLQHLPWNTQMFLDSFCVASIVYYEWRLYWSGCDTVVTICTVHGTLPRLSSFHIP